MSDDEPAALADDSMANGNEVNVPTAVSAASDSEPVSAAKNPSVCGEAPECPYSDSNRCLAKYIFAQRNVLRDLYC
jgi:hypothetical protein